MIPVLIWDFYLYGNSTEKMNISKVTALRAPHTVGGRPQRATATRGGADSPVVGAISRSLAWYRTVDLEGKSKENE